MTQYTTDAVGNRCLYQKLSPSLAVLYTEIPQKRYEELKAMTYSEVETEIENEIPSYFAGLGYYGHLLRYDAEQDVYLLGLECGTSYD